MAEILKEVYETLNKPDEARQKRVNKMVALYKYRFQWSRKVFIEKVFEWIPELRSEVTEEALRKSATKQLFAAMEIKHMNAVLSRLEQIEKYNKNKRVKSDGNSRFNNK